MVLFCCLLQLHGCRNKELQERVKFVRDLDKTSVLAAIFVLTVDQSDFP